MIYPTSRILSSPNIPGDKSISHRALFLGALANGKTQITHLLKSEDVFSTRKCLSHLGVEITQENETTFLVSGKGLYSLTPSQTDLDCGNSGTTIRLLMGILSGSPFSSTLKGDSSLSRRPMKRIATPLSKMGAQIHLYQGEYAPLQLTGTRALNSLQYELPVASAQLKSALLFAGLFAHGETCLSGKIQSRDHTERLFPHFGVKLQQSNHEISIQGGQHLYGTSVHIPGDLSSAAFWIVAALLIPGSQLELNHVSLNPTRLGLIRVLNRMGAQIDIHIEKQVPEPMGSLRVTYGPLQGTKVHADEIPALIDEIPLLSILAPFAEGKTEIHGAEELRAKETDRIEAVAENLRRMGAQVHTFPDGIMIPGNQSLKGARLDSFHDHRIAMAFSIAALAAEGPSEILNPECVDISYPTFFETLGRITQ